MAADCSFLHSSTAFTTVFAPYFSADGGGLLILSLVNGFHDGLRAVMLCGWQRIARRIAQRMAAHWSFFRSSMAFPTVCAPYCSADGSALLILPLLKGFHDGLRTALLTGWQRIAPSSARQRLFRRFTHRNAQRMTADCSYFRSSKPFTTDCAPFCSVDGSALLILQFVKGFHDGVRAVLLSALQRIAHNSARQRLSQRFARRIAQQMAADCSFLHSSTGFTTICTLYCSANGSADGITAQLWVHSFRPLVDDFPNILCAVDCSPHRSFLCLSSAFTRVYMPDCSADSSADHPFFGWLMAICSRRFAYRFAWLMAHRIPPYSRS